MRRQVRATARLGDNEAAGQITVRLPLPVRWLMRRPVDSIAGTIAALAAITILINALFLQSGPHPAPTR